LKLVGNLLQDESELKKGVNHNPLTIIAATNDILGAMATDGSEELMVKIYEMIADVLFGQLQRVAEKHAWPESIRVDLNAICNKISDLYPFAHRTTIQDMLNGHTKTSSDQWLGESFRQSMAELEAAGYKPPKVVVNQDPHFADFKPSFKNGEIRQIVIGCRTTLKTGYQFNVANVAPIGLINAIDLAPKRQINGADLGDLQYAVVYGKAIERANEAGLTLKQVQGDRGLEVLGIFAVSRDHAWPAISGEIGALAEYTKAVFMITPWSSTHYTKADLIACKEFTEVTIKSAEILRNQYMGNQPLVRLIQGPDPPCKIPIETAVLTLRKQNEKYGDFDPREMQVQLDILTNDLTTNEKRLETLKAEYFCLLREVNPDYKERGLEMKLNSMGISQLSKEPSNAWAVRKQYRAVQGKIRVAKQKRDAFLRDFQIFEIGVDKAALDLLKGSPCKARSVLINKLKSCGKDYCSRWCIESGFEIIEYQFPLHYHGYSSDTHIRCFVVQAAVFNSYRVAQIKHIGATKPHNWRPWNPKNKICCRQFRTAERRTFSTKGYILKLLRESMNNYFCRALD